MPTSVSHSRGGSRVIDYILAVDQRAGPAMCLVYDSSALGGKYIWLPRKVGSGP
jgi:hypothetical protein